LERDVVISPELQLTPSSAGVVSLQEATFTFTFVPWGVSIFGGVIVIIVVVNIIICVTLHKRKGTDVNLEVGILDCGR
jgi:hypothetical protein